MAEDLSKNNIEAEIAELSQKIAEKRKILEANAHMVDERDLVRGAVAEQLSNTVPTATTTQTASTAATAVTQTATQTSTKSAVGKSYLDFLDLESRDIVDRLVEEVFSKGMDKTFKALEMQEPYIIDAFHDILTDKLYLELKKRGLLK